MVRHLGHQASLDSFTSSSDHSHQSLWQKHNVMPPRRTSVSQPHSVSLKVLRLSRPSLALSEPLPTDGPLLAASLAHPSQPSAAFPLTPLLTLPPSFGAAYVGEPFSCTLSANNEHAQPISDVHIEAHLQTPSAPKGIPLLLLPAEPCPLGPQASLQRIVRHELAEEGAHVLAVTVAYQGRSFRKLYQFAAQQALGVRTKIGPVGGASAWAVEAQVENLTAAPVVLDCVALEPAAGVRGLKTGRGKETVGPGDVLQVAFWLERDGEVAIEQGRWVLGRLRVDWRMGMGQEGTLRTGWLGCVKR